MLHLPSNLQPHVNCHANAVFTIFAFPFPLVLTFCTPFAPWKIFVNPIFRAVKVQQTARRCANDYWLKLCHQIRSAADTGNIKEMYDRY